MVLLLPEMTHFCRRSELLSDNLIRHNSRLVMIMPDRTTSCNG